MCIGHMKSNDFPWKTTKYCILIASCYDESQLVNWRFGDYQKFDNFFILPVRYGNEIISNFSEMYYISFAIPSLGIKMDADSWKIKSKFH